MTMFKAKRGLETQLPTEITDGVIYFCTDTGNVFFDFHNTRLQISAEKTKFDSDGNLITDTYARIADIPKQIQIDWNQTDETKSDFIKNKPTLGALASKDIVDQIDLSTELQTLIETYILNINYDALFAFDTSEIVTGATPTTSVLGQAILGQMVLA